MQELYTSHNLITKIPKLHNPLLNTLDISNNQIKLVENLSHLSNLEELWVLIVNKASYNQFDSFEDICKELSPISNLRTVYFEGNLIQADDRPQYRIKLKMLLPQIIQIDATIIR